MAPVNSLKDVNGIRVEIRFSPEDTEVVREALAEFLAATKDVRYSCLIDTIHDVDNTEGR